jgi:hypothetical protein
LTLEDGTDQAVPKLTTDEVGLKIIERYVERGQERWPVAR